MARRTGKCGPYLDFLDICASSESLEKHKNRAVKGRVAPWRSPHIYAPNPETKDCPASVNGRPCRNRTRGQYCYPHTKHGPKKGVGKAANMDAYLNSKNDAALVQELDSMSSEEINSKAIAVPGWLKRAEAAWNKLRGN